MDIVIIGNGVAGIEAALTVREREPAWNVTIISEESDHFFSRTALMWVFSGQLSHRCIEPHERDLYERLRIRRVRARAIGLDTASKRVLMAGDQPAVSYDRLLIACGSKPRPGVWPGSDLDGVGHFVTLQDLEWFETEVHGGPRHGGRPPRPGHHLAFSTPDSPYRPRPEVRGRRGGAPREPAVIGGGLIGIEAVEVMHAAGLHPRFLIREDWFWPIALEPREGRWISDRMSDHGVRVHLDENVKELRGNSTLSTLVTDKGEYECDLCIIAIGVVPNTDWLRPSPQGEGPYRQVGEPVELQDRSGAIVVDEHLSTSVPDVFAAGDCAAVRWYNGAVRPEQLWYTARDQGRVAGRSLLGDRRASYDRGLWYNSAKLMDIEYTTAGLVNMNVEEERNWFYEEKGPVRSTTRVVLSGDRVIGFNLLGRRWNHAVMLRWIEERRSLAFVLDHLTEASFDTELTPPLVIPASARQQDLSGAAPSVIPDRMPPPPV